MPRRGRDAFELTLSPEEEQDFVDHLLTHLDDALAARSQLDEDADYWRRLYEQGRTRLASNMPWPDAMDLTSYLGTESVDSLHALIGRALIYQEPIWTVEAWGEAQTRAPLVQDFHQWKAEEERLQSVLDRATLLSLIDPMAIIETSEAAEVRSVRKRVRARLALDPVTGGPMLDESGEPMLARDAEGRLVEVEDPDEPSGEAVIDETTRIRTGPQHRVIPYRDFYVLPGHARDKTEVWGYAKRFWKRLPEIQGLAERKVYRAEAVTALDETPERQQDEHHERSGVTVTEQAGPKAEKALWEFLVLFQFPRDDTERWYLATVHEKSRRLLRVQHDDLAAKRFLLLVPFPRPDSIYGYSLIGDKLITVIEEHTAWRNLLGDTAQMSLMTPIKRLQTALWDPEEQPIGPKAVIDVRDMNEVQPMQMPDVSRGALEREREVKDAAVRLSGITETALGTNPQVDRTLGEVQLVARQSFGRMQLPLQRLYEPLEELFQIRHLIWQRTLQENQDLGRLPSRLLTGLETRGVFVPEGRVTAELLMGAFRGKPRGSVDTADPAAMRVDLTQFLQLLPQLLQMWPTLQQQLQTPQAAQAILEEVIRAYRFQNRQALIGTSGQTGAQPSPGTNPVLQRMQSIFGGQGPPALGGGGATPTNPLEGVIPSGGEGDQR